MLLSEKDTPMTSAYNQEPIYSCTTMATWAALSSKRDSVISLTSVFQTKNELNQPKQIKFDLLITRGHIFIQIFIRLPLFGRPSRRIQITAFKKRFLLGRFQAVEREEVLEYL